jgi:class 3 adenylate cyclase/pimeloyl-ACP methyl ester carboxylesterase
VEIPETRYTKTVDGVHIAYQVLGHGPVDFVLVTSSYTSNIEIAWEWRYSASLFRGLAARGRLLVFDRRGTGLSDGVIGERLPSLDARMDDIRAVMDAADSERAVLCGLEDGGALCFLFGATYPERTAGIITIGASSRGSWAPDYPWTWNEEEWAEWLNKIEAGWGTAEFVQDLVRWVFPSHAEDAEFVRGYARVVRHSLSPGDAVVAERMFKETDVRHVLPAIQAPTLVLHFAEDQVESAQEGHYIAEHIPGAVFVELPGVDHGTWISSPSRFSDIDRFLASLRAEQQEFDRVLATVLFTDIVGSTEKAAELGDRAWKQLLDRHHRVVRGLLGRYRGREIDTAGDGFFATFDGPARGVRCAQAIAGAVQPLGLEIRAGLHTGEIEIDGDDVRGIAVHIGARVGALAGPSQILVSSTVKDLVAGSGLTFEDASEHELKGVPDRWHLYRVME